MGRFNITDTTMSAELRKFSNRVAMYDENGTMLGYFEPNSKAPPEDREPTSEELDERVRSSKRYSFNEMWEKIYRGERF